MKSAFQLRFLGPVQIERGGEPVRGLGSRKALALLAYLAVTGQSHTRDALATLLWPEQDQSRARNSLRGALVTLRKALGEGWLEADRESVGLCQGADPSTSLAEHRELGERTGRGFWLDVAEFRYQLAECQTHGHPPDEVCPACLRLLTGAAELYRGDFMAGFTLPDSPAFDAWQYSTLSIACQNLFCARRVAGLSGGLDVGTRVTESRSPNRTCTRTTFDTISIYANLPARTRRGVLKHPLVDD